MTTEATHLTPTFVAAPRLTSLPPAELPEALLEELDIEDDDLWGYAASCLLAAIVVHLQYARVAVPDALTFIRTHGPDSESVALALRDNLEHMPPAAHDFVFRTSEAFLEHPNRTRAGVLTTLLRLLRTRHSP